MEIKEKEVKAKGTENIPNIIIAENLPDLRKEVVIQV
jgi:hypothetical protein